MNTLFPGEINDLIHTPCNWCGGQEKDGYSRYGMKDVLFRCQRCTMVNSTNPVRKTIFKRPCSCCGQSDHGVIAKARIIGSSRVSHFICPLVTNKRSFHVGKGVEDMIFWPTPETFAKGYLYKRETACIALIPFRMYGGGRWMGNLRFLNFKDEVLRICDGHPSSTRT